MPGKHSISIISKQGGRFQDHTPGASVQSISLHKTTMIYLDVLDWRGKGVKNPVDELYKKDEVCYIETI